MTVASVGWLKTVGLSDYECNACGWNVAAGEPRVYTYVGDGRPHRVWTEYRLDEKREPVIELREHVDFVYHYHCYDNQLGPMSKPPKIGDGYYLTDKPRANSKLLDLGESHD